MHCFTKMNYEEFIFTVTTCTFESGFCDFANDLLSDDFDWTIGKYTKSLTTGPIFDHTTGKGLL